MKLMTRPDSIHEELEELRQRLPDPFRYGSDLDHVLAGPAARRVLDRGRPAVEALLDVIEEGREPVHAHVAALLLSECPPDVFYPTLLDVLGRSAEATVSAVETGFWRVALPDDRKARDLVEVVRRSDNAGPLLLLQRPAARAVRPALRAFIEARRVPLSRYALMAYDLAAGDEDLDFLREVATWEEPPSLRALAALALLRHGRREAGEALLGALESPDVELRRAVYAGLAAHIPARAREAAAFDPDRPPASQREAIERLRAALGEA